MSAISTGSGAPPPLLISATSVPSLSVMTSTNATGVTASSTSATSAFTPKLAHFVSGTSPAAGAAAVESESKLKQQKHSKHVTSAKKKNAQLHFRQRLFRAVDFLGFVKHSPLDRANLYSLSSFWLTTFSSASTAAPILRRNYVSASSATTFTATSTESQPTQTKFHFHSDTHGQAPSLSDSVAETDFHRPLAETWLASASPPRGPLHTIGETPLSWFDRVVAVTALSGQSWVLGPGGPDQIHSFSLLEGEEESVVSPTEVVASHWLSMDVFAPQSMLDASEEALGLDRLGESSIKCVVAVLSLVHKQEQAESEYSLRIHGIGTPWTPIRQEHYWKRFVKDHQTLRLEYRAVFIRSVNVALEGHYPQSLLVSGDDGQFHLYVMSMTSTKFHETPLQEHFPFLTGVQEGYRRVLTYQHQLIRDLSITAIGCQNGMLSVAISQWSDTIQKYDVKVQKEWAIYVGGPITSLLVFETNSHAEDPNISLLVTCATNVAIIFENVQTLGLEQAVILPHSDHYDAILCAMLMDVDFDGQLEMVLGTFSHHILIYKRQDGFSGEDSSLSDSRYELIWTTRLTSPVYGLVCTDLFGDGVLELIAICLRGIHVLQHSRKSVQKKLDHIGFSMGN